MYASIEIERLSISSFPVGVSPLRVSDHTNAFRRGQYLRALPAYAKPPALLVGYLMPSGEKIPPVLSWEEKKLSHEAFRRKANT